MSTNYYLKRIPTKEEISQCHKLLDDRKIEYCDRYGEGYDAPYLEQVLEKWYRYGPPQIIANDGSRWWDADFS